MDAGNPLRYMPIGQSGAAAVVLCALYFLGATVTTVSWVRSKFKWYEVRKALSLMLPSTAQQSPVLHLEPTHY